MTISIDELLQQQDVPDNVFDLVKSSLQVIPVTIYKLQSKYSSYAYTEDELDYSSDHIRQLIDDIIIANLDKVKHLDNRVYRFFEEGKTYFVVTNNKVFKQVVSHIWQYLQQDYREGYILKEYIYFEGNYPCYNNDVTASARFSKDIIQFFETEDEALNYIEKEQNGQIN
jgi:hypothetical protein